MTMPLFDIMKRMRINGIFLSLLLWLVYPVYAQKSDIGINGKITALDDGQPVHRASVSISRKGIGTATNTAGLFVLIIPAANLADSLKISCIGFKTKHLAIANLKNGEELNIVLEKNTTELKEVTVTYYDAAKILKKALDRIPENYINLPHILRGFYRMYAYDKETPLQLSEAVFDVYNFGYADKRADQFRLVKARNEKNDRDFALEFQQKPNTIFEKDVVNHIYASGFLNDEGLTRHQFEATGIVDVKGYRAYEIDFKEKKGETDKTFRGKMYIDTKTYAFIYFDFGLSPGGLDNLGSEKFDERALTRTRDADVGVLADNTKVSYQEVGSKWVLSGVEGDDSLSVKSDSLKYKYTTHVKFNYQVTAVDTAQKASFSTKIARTDNINAYKSNGDEKFWKDYNILLSDYDTEEVFRNIVAINKALLK
jgi:hypothetical protein